MVIISNVWLFSASSFEHFQMNCLQRNAAGPHWLPVNIGSGDGLLLSGNKPLHEPCWIRTVMPYGVTSSRWINSVMSISALWNIRCDDASNLPSKNLILYHVSFRLYRSVNLLTLKQFLIFKSLTFYWDMRNYINGSVEDVTNSIVNAVALQ